MTSSSIQSPSLSQIQSLPCCRHIWSIPMATLAGGSGRFRPYLHCFAHVCYSSEDQLTESPSNTGRFEMTSHA
jgi:hypothetical protein